LDYFSLKIGFFVSFWWFLRGLNALADVCADLTEIKVEAAFIWRFRIIFRVVL
jgi:hypothetical protein